MSIIVYRAGVMAADTRSWSGAPPPIGEKMKIRRLDDGVLVGAVTNQPGQAEALMDWFAQNCPQDARPRFAGELSFIMLAVRPDGQALYFCDDFYPSGPLVAPYFAIGSGSSYAMGALACGASALEAVQIAMQMDVHSGGQIAALTHFDETEKPVDEAEKPAKRKKASKKTA